MTTDLTRGTAHDVLRYDKNPLSAIFAPRSVAVIGATERKDSIGRAVIRNLVNSDFSGAIFPVNPQRDSVLDLKAYPEVTAIPDPVDLAIIVTPAATVPGVVRECADAGVRGAVIISAGFRETGPQGAALEQKILAEARRGNLRIIGPNCLGVMSPAAGLNATFGSALARPGSVGFISQSGALCTAVLDWSLRENVGFSAFISIGSMLDVDWGDLIYYLGDDAHTKSILIYMETVGDARSFLSAAREVALTKPIIVIKPGRTQAAARAAASHTGALTGNDEVLAAAFRRCGVLRVDTVDDLFNMAEVLAKQPRARGPRLTIVTNAGGPGVLATDALIGQRGELTPLSAEIVDALDEFLPPHWSRNNPIDILGDADAERYEKTIGIVSKDPASDGLLVILTPQAMSQPVETAQALKKHYDRPAGYPYGKPVLASWMGGEAIAEGELILNEANIPTFAFPDTAARVFQYMWRYQKRLNSLYETPHLPPETEESVRRRDEIGAMLEAVRQSGRTLLTEYESKQVLASYDIPVVPTQLAYSADEAVAAAEAIGYPVAVKLNSETITHKSDVGGVRLELGTAVEVRHAYESMAQTVARKFSADDFLGVSVQPMLNLRDGYELIIGCSPDEQFGPVLLFGAGGTLVEVFADRTLGLPPLTTTLARRMMERTKIYRALRGVRSRQAGDLAALEALMVRFSQLVVTYNWIKEIEINPLFVSGQQIVALDARIVLYDAQMSTAALPRLAIRPYPDQYVASFTDRSGEELVIRPIRPEDEPAMVRFHETLSEESVYLRYFRAFQLSQRVEHERLRRICFVDYDRDVALVVERDNAETGQKDIIAVGRLTKARLTDDAEFAMLVSDAYQGRGIGTVLLQRLLQIGRDEGVRRVEAYMLDENLGMRAICEKMGFEFGREGGVIKAAIAL